MNQNKYQSYKPSGVEWIGEIPEDWKMFRVSNFGTFFKGNGIKKDEVKDEGLPCIRYGEIYTKYNRVVYNPLSFIDEETSKSSIQIKKGDILFTGSGETIKDIGKSLLYFGEENIFVGGDIIVLRLNKGIDPLYLSYLMDTHFIQYQKSLMGRGEIIVHIYSKNIKEIKTPLPPLQEQLQIVQFLDEKTKLIDKLISTKERKVILLKEQRISLINQVVTKGLNPDVKMKYSGVEWIGDIPEHWNMVSIKNLVSTKITDGPHETPEWVEEGIPFLSVESVQDNKLDFNKKRGYITEELHKIYSKKCKPQRDDIFIVKSGSTTGKSTIVETDEEFNIWSPLCIVRSNNDKILPRFFFNSIQSFYFRRFIELGWSFGTQPNIGMGVIENLKIVLPPLKEQQPIIDFLNHKIIDIDNLVDLEQKKIDLLKEYRQSLISEVVTGKIKVTN